ncbi:hypothetical protein [Sulfurirhabdus autotrophica]|uniref:Uncharacterized protein n=1 Tax=Sulfurirhabdus autotrophica TaxID=1706046 RepID=A0A4R3YDD7_9PROT|nr:hypothetical protein [Sulfurirhabdus autotrophica]TCV90117.1 hypothetical protein EDC63_10184 [Sulfurirhabdus autotrophica]
MINQLQTQKIDLVTLFHLNEHQGKILVKLADGMPFLNDDFDDAVIYVDKQRVFPCNNRMARILAIVAPDQFSDDNVLLNADFSELGLIDEEAERSLQ